MNNEGNDLGRVASPPGSREPDPQAVPAASGFDPSRGPFFFDPARSKLIDYVLGYGGRCRECADNDGICRGSGLPCKPDQARKAVEHVLAALAFYEENPQFVGGTRPSALIEREGVVRWLYATADTARRMFPGEENGFIRRQLVGTLQTNADAIGRGEHRRPPRDSAGRSEAEASPE